eukprot:scaffold77227_cov18-Tisochrysis_lutea.AAC.1
MLLILHVILGITKVTGRRVAINPSSLLRYESVDTKANWATLRVRCSGYPGTGIWVGMKGEYSTAPHRENQHYQPRETASPTKYKPAAHAFN